MALLGSRVLHCLGTTWRIKFGVAILLRAMMPAASYQNSKNLPESARQPNEKTVKRYDAIFKSIRQEAGLHESGGCLEEAPYVGFIDTVKYFSRTEIHRNRSTHASYRSALLYALSQPEQLQYPEAAQAYDFLIRQDRHAKILTPKKLCRKVVARKIRWQDVRKLIGALDNKKSRNGVHWGNKVATWLLAGIATGLRPGQWANTSLPRIYPGDAQRLIALESCRVKSTLTAEQVCANKLCHHEVPMQSGESWSIQKRWELVLDDRCIQIVEAQRSNIAEYLAYPSEKNGKPRTFRAYYQRARNVLQKACLEVFHDAAFLSIESVRELAARYGGVDGVPDDLIAMMGKRGRIQNGSAGTRV
jgi:hypothetical protein